MRGHGPAPVPGAPTASFDPLVPRSIDLPTPVPLDVDVRSGPAAELLDDAKIFIAPESPGHRRRWREQLVAWREGARERHGFAPTVYDRSDDNPARACFAVAQVWLWDELFYDAVAERFTPDRFLDDAQERFGGLDGVVLWHAYPVIGIDERNQWDWYHDVPDLPDVVRHLQGRGTAVFVDYNPWDTGTRRGADDATELARVVDVLGADGVFLDTMKQADAPLVAALEAARPGIALLSESKLPTPSIADHSMSWAQWFADSAVPGVLRAHWYERRHRQLHVRRWHRDHAEELRSAWLNGVGVMVWEVVFGAWVGWSERDEATLRRMLPVQRHFAELLLKGEWIPLADIGTDAERAGVVASRFTSDGVSLLLLANPTTQAAEISVEVPGRPDGRLVGLHDAVGEADGSLLVPVVAGGIAAVLHLEPGADRPAGVAQLQERLAAERPVTHGSFTHRPARRHTPAPTSGEPRALGTVAVPGGEHVLTVRYRCRETGMYDGAPFVDEWKPLPPRLHDLRTLERRVTLARGIQVATAEVSVVEYAAFLAARGEPARSAGLGSQPVTGVTLREAREYAAWVGGRLPTEDEWQLAAGQRGFRRLEPRVWNWTESEHSDGRTRFVMLKGGADFTAEGSAWYVDGGVHPPEWSLKYLLPGLGLDASSTIGFRVCWEERA